MDKTDFQSGHQVASEEWTSSFNPRRRDMLRGLVASALGGSALALASPVLPAALSGTPHSRVLPANSVVDLDARGMQLIITGSGSALPDPFRGGPSCAIVVDGQILQFDCGRRIMENLMLVGINPARIDNVFITHLHFDHIGDYDYYAYMVWLSGRQEPVSVFGPAGTRSMSTGAIEYMHEKNFNFISRIAKREWSSEGAAGPAPNPPFAVSDVQPGVVLETDLFKVTSAEVVHHVGEGTTSLAYRVDTEYGSVAISGDTGPSEALVTLARDVDILVHECVVPDFGMTTGGSFSREAWHEREQPAHTTPSQLGVVSNRTGTRMLVPYHLPPYGSVPAAVEMSSLYYGSETDASIWTDFIASMRTNYDGPIVLAEDRMIFSVGK